VYTFDLNGEPRLPVWVADRVLVRSGKELFWKLRGTVSISAAMGCPRHASMRTGLIRKVSIPFWLCSLSGCSIWALLVPSDGLF